MFALHRLLCLVLVFCVSMAATSVAVAQSSRDQNARALKQYLAPRQVTELEWELVQFNLIWQGARVGSADYVTSHPLSFDAKAMRFRATFSIQEKREFNDPEPWFQLPRARRESTIQGAVDHLLDLLAQSFPEVKSRPALVYVEFWFRSKGGGKSVIAKFENGTLSLTE